MILIPASNEGPRVGAVVRAARRAMPGVDVMVVVNNCTDDTAAQAEAAGATVIMDRCPKIEYGGLYGELSWSGVNSRIISAKRPRIMQRRRNG